MKLRKALVHWHRWFGLLGGIWLFALALTGSIVVFYQELDQALNADLFELATGGHTLPVADLLATVEDAYPGTYAGYVDLPDGPTEPLIVFPRAKKGSDVELPAGFHVFVDPPSGEILASRVFGAFELDRRHLSMLVYRLHRDLYLGRTGTLALGLLAFLWVLDHLVSVLLSFPQPKKWLDSFRVKKGVRGIKKAWSLHRAMGLWLLPVTLALAVSGVYFNWYPLFLDTVDIVSPLTPRHDKRAERLDEPLYDASVDLDAALAAFEEVDVGSETAAKVDSVSLLPHVGLYWLRVFDERDLSHYGARYVHVDMTTGKVVSDRHARDGSAGDEFVAWQYPLHSGQAFGWPGRIAVLLAGLATCTLTATGFVIWAKKRRGRRKARGKTHGGACLTNRTELVQYPLLGRPPNNRAVAERPPSLIDHV